MRMELLPPVGSQIEEFISMLANKMNLNLASDKSALVRTLKGSSFSEIEDFVSDLARSYVLSLPGGELGSIVDSKVRQWKARPSVPNNRHQKTPR